MEMQPNDTKWVAIGIAVIVLVVWASDAAIQLSRHLVERSCVEHGYVLKRIGDDILWVKEQQ